jgi:hypothetical protein
MDFAARHSFPEIDSIVGDKDIATFYRSIQYFCIRTLSQSEPIHMHGFAKSQLSRDMRESGTEAFIDQELH